VQSAIAENIIVTHFHKIHDAFGKNDAISQAELNHSSRKCSRCRFL